MKKQSGFVPILILLFLLAIVGAGYFAYQRSRSFTGKNGSLNLYKSPLPSPRSSLLPSSDPTAEWKTYSNKLFSFKYLPDMVVETDNNNDFVNTLSTFENGDSKWIAYVEESTPGQVIDSYSASVGDGGSIDGFYAFTQIQNKTIKVNNTIAKYFEHSTNVVNKNRSIIAIPNGKYVIVLNLPTEMLDQILSTFKFTNPTQTLQIYNDEKNKYSFSYSSSWKIVPQVPTTFLYRDYSNRKDWMEYFNNGGGRDCWLSGKMFVGDCRDPILQNINDPNQLIALEIVSKDGDGPYCWSSGYFMKDNKWQVGENYMYPISIDNSGSLTNVEWKGDYFKFQPLSSNSTLEATAGLANINTYALKGADELDQILKTFKFTNK